MSKIYLNEHIVFEMHSTSKSPYNNLDAMKLQIVIQSTLQHC